MKNDLPSFPRRTCIDVPQRRRRHGACVVHLLRKDCAMSERDKILADCMRHLEWIAYTTYQKINAIKPFDRDSYSATAPVTR